MNYLFIYPHPDDETFFTGGLLQKLTSLGHTVNLVILSRGEASTLKHGLTSQGSFADVRTNELNLVCKKLGVNELIIKDFPDGKFTEYSKEIESYISLLISEKKPNYIFTFEPFGAYGHPDHIEISKIVTKLVFKDNLIYVTIDPNFKFTEGTRSMNKTPDKVASIPNYIYKLSSKEFFTKLKAMQLYKSQTNSENNLRHTLQAIWVMRKEYFTFHGLQRDISNSVFLLLDKVN